MTTIKGFRGLQSETDGSAVRSSGISSFSKLSVSSSSSEVSQETEAVLLSENTDQIEEGSSSSISDLSDSDRQTLSVYSSAKSATSALSEISSEIQSLGTSLAEDTLSSTVREEKEAEIEALSDEYNSIVESEGQSASGDIRQALQSYSITQELNLDYSSASAASTSNQTLEDLTAQVDSATRQIEGATQSVEIAATELQDIEIDTEPVSKQLSEDEATSLSSVIADSILKQPQLAVEAIGRLDEEEVTILVRSLDSLDENYAE